jgi:hypothetical protein
MCIVITCTPEELEKHHLDFLKEDVKNTNEKFGTFRREGKVVDSLIGDTTRMPNFDMIQPLGKNPSRTLSVQP